MPMETVQSHERVMNILIGRIFSGSSNRAISFRPNASRLRSQTSTAPLSGRGSSIWKP